MKKLLVTLDEDSSNLLAKMPNKSETVRRALKVYIDDISPDRIAAIGLSYKRLRKDIDDLRERIDYLTEQVDRLVTKAFDPYA